jgi:uncharacterized protein (TIGR04255 family)
MTIWERFSKAPIVEALLDIAVGFSSPVEPARLEAFQDAIRDDYPAKQSRVKWEGAIQVAQEVVQQAVKRGPQGFMFTSGDGQRMVQVRQDGFTFNWLKPYDRWESFRDEARQHWGRFRDTFGPEAVTRLGLRYINRLDLPLPFSDFREYVTTLPDIAPDLPQGLSALFMRLEIPDPNRGLIAIVTETFQSTINEGKELPLIFDIDIVRESTFEPSSPAIWETFEQMREYKNEVFFGSVTERAKELFR